MHMLGLLVIPVIYLLYKAFENYRKPEYKPVPTCENSRSNDDDIINALNDKRLKYIELACTCETDFEALSNQQETLYRQADNAKAVNNIDRYEKLTAKADSIGMKLSKLEIAAANARVQAVKTQKQIDRLKAGH